MSDLRYECPYCRGTGIYVGTMERPGEGVVCNICRGLGGVSFDSVFNAPIFRGRKRRDGITIVHFEIGRKRGEYIGKSVSADDFYNGIMPVK